MPEKENEEIVDSQKLSKRDKKEIKEGLCVNCAIFAESPNVKLSCSIFLEAFNVKLSCCVV